jgi:hypothetical protein
MQNRLKVTYMISSQVRSKLNRLLDVVCFLLVAFILCNNSNAATACRPIAQAEKANPTATPPLATHPRILIRSAEITYIKKLIASGNADALSLFNSVTNHNNWILSTFPNPYPIPAPQSLSLTTAREIQDIIATNAGLYLLTGNTTYSKRAIAEMLQVTQYPDWNPTDYLVLAETTQAMAIGYDWLYSVLTAAERQTIVNAIVKNSLTPALSALNEGAYSTPNSNWTAVVNGALLNGALAIDGQTSLVQQILTPIKLNLTSVGGMYTPSGGWVEGPGYFVYATKYYTYAVATLFSALGTDWGLGEITGYKQAGAYGVYENGPTYLSFNYADAASTPIYTSAMMWLGRFNKTPIYGMSEFNVINSATVTNLEKYNSAQMSDFIMELLWFAECEGGTPTWPSVDHISNGSAASGDAFVFLRQAWNNSSALSVAMKGGNNVGSGHSHADLGSFVLDGFGIRWGMQSGGESYSLPNMFPGGSASLATWNERLYYYRNSTAGQNTLTISNTYQTAPSFANQYGFGTSTLVAYSSNPGILSFGVVDLTNAYSNVVANNTPLITSALRGIALFQGTTVLVRDEIQASAPVDIVWNFHTQATISIDPTKTVATLTDPASGKTMVATILSPMNGAFFEVISTNPNTVTKSTSWTGTNGCTAAANTWTDTIGCIESTNAGIYNLVIRMPQASISKTDVIQVVFNQTGAIPSDLATAIVNLGPLRNWVIKGPVTAPTAK